jgi:hypothetical protein
MFGTKTLLAIAIATTALSGSAALASSTSRPAQTAHAAPMKAKETKTTTTSCRDHKGKFVQCARSTRTTASVRPATKAPARKPS